MVRIRLFQRKGEDRDAVVVPDELSGAAVAVPAITVRTPQQLIPELASTIKEIHPDFIPRIVELCSDLMAREPALQQEFPQKLAACAILLYLESFSISINDHRFAELVRVHDTHGLLKRLRRL